MKAAAKEKKAKKKAAAKEKKAKKKAKMKERGGGAIEVMCLKCQHTEIIYLPAEVPKCPDCNIRMSIREVLREGKSY